jgi:hypothetical protein
MSEECTYSLCIVNNVTLKKRSNYNLFPKKVAGE